MSATQAVLFDLGNVLIRINMGNFWNTLGLECPLKPFQHRDEIIPFSRSFEAGEIPKEEFLAGLEETFRGRFKPAELEAAFNSILVHPIKGMDDLVRRVSSVCATGLVSNTNELHYAATVARWNIVQLLPRHYLSFRLHAMKPDAAYYRSVLDDLQKDIHCVPEQVVFIDDLVKNIEGAERAGMRGIQFKSVCTLEEELKGLGVL
jgi:putative hydrolase of the HAD superfamily